MARTTPENCRFPLGICTTSNTWFLGPTRVFIQNAITIDSAVFAQLTVVSHYCTIGRYVSPKIGISSPCRKRTEPRQWATSTRNVVKIARVVREMCSRTDRHTHTQTCSLQYFATAPAGEEINTSSDHH